MADSTIPLTGTGTGKVLDTETLTGAGSATVERQRVELTGAALIEVARIQNSAPAGTEYALVTRPIMPATTVVSQSTAANLNATATLASMAAATSTPTGVVSLGNSLGKTTVMKTGTLASVAATADQVVLTYTVTAGKTFYLEYLSTNARLTTFAATATNFGDASLESPAGTKLLTRMNAGSGIGDAEFVTFPEPIAFAAGTVVRIVCTPSAATAFTWRGNLGGYEK